MSLQEAVDELFEPHYMQGCAWTTIYLAFHDSCYLKLNTSIWALKFSGNLEFVHRPLGSSGRGTSACPDVH